MVSVKVLMSKAQFVRQQPARIRTKRIYDSPFRSDGRRILVDRLWPRGVPKANARIDFWAKDVAPTTKLRIWYGHDPKEWLEFRRRYFAELDANFAGVAELRAQMGSSTVTLLYGTTETCFNNASALCEYLKQPLKKPGSTSRKTAHLLSA